MPTIKGTASVSDDHAMSKQLRQTKFPKIFSTKVRIDKVNVPVMSQWIEKRIAEILGFEDEIVASMAINLFLEPQDGMDPRRAQLNLAGFLGDEQSALFCDSLWRLLLDAQDQTAGIPTVILEEKKTKMQLEKEQLEALLAEEKCLRLPNDDAQHRRPVEYPERNQRGRELERRPPPNQYHRHPQVNRVPPPHPQRISPARPSVDEFGRVTQDGDDVRKPRAHGGDRDRPSRGPRDRGDIEHQPERRSRRSVYPEERRGRHCSDDRRRFQRDNPRYNERDEYRRRRPREERRRRRSRSSSSSSRSRSSPSRSRSRSTSRSRSPS
ncbi:PWI domain [Fragilaria crotonensis]|nr:PWI domain [Fragilaria crotonensis]